MINVFQPTLGKEELERLEKVFASNWIGKGKLVSEFEEIYAQHLGSTKDRVLSTNCCSEGLFASMHLFDIQPGDEVILPTISFVGAGNAVRANGSRMVLCDVDKHTLNARATDIEKCITPKTKAILLLHFGGIPCEMDEIMKLADTYNLKVIEDCAAGVCSSYKGRALGTIGDMGMWSFDAMKILVSGDGAMLHFRDPELREKAEKWFYFGLETKSGYENSVAQKWWEFDISCFGHRAIMNDITAALALEQYKNYPHIWKSGLKCTISIIITCGMRIGSTCLLSFRLTARHPIISIIFKLKTEREICWRSICGKTTFTLPIVTFRCIVSRDIMLTESLKMQIMLQITLFVCLYIRACQMMMSA